MKPLNFKTALGIGLIQLACLNGFAQLRPIEKLPPKKEIATQSNSTITDVVKVSIHFPKKAITREQLIDLIRPENSALQTSSVPLTAQSNCTANVIDSGNLLSNCWTRNTKSIAKSAITSVYKLLENNDPEYYTIETTLDYRGLAPRTSLISFWLDRNYFQRIKAGNWKITDKTLCRVDVPENRWAEFAYQPGAGYRGFAVRGYCGDTSICSTLSKTESVDFWVVAP